MPADTSHEVIAPLQPSDAKMIIWRYLDLPKLIDFLRTRRLHFARVDTLGDPYEGTLTRVNLEARAQQLQGLIAASKGKQALADLQQQHTNITHVTRTMAFVNCWHGGATESAAMWKMYGTATGSVVIQSSYEKLVRALPAAVEEMNIFFLGVGVIRYMNYNSEDWIPVRGNAITPFLYKRKEFEYEQEVRALAFAAPPPTNGTRGVSIDVDVDELVDSIRVQPTTSDWARDAIRDVIAQYGLNARVKPSQIDLAPRY